MSSINLPSAEHLDATKRIVDRDVVLPRPPLALRHEQEHPWEGDLAPDEDGDVSFSLPIFARVEVLPEEGSTECFMVATRNKLAFGRGGDGLTAYGNINRRDFTFRTNVFESFPEVIRHNRAELRPGEWNEMAMALSEREATYWINGVLVATCILREGDLPSTELYLGLTRYMGRRYGFRRFDVSRDPAVLAVFLDRVVTLHCDVLDGGAARLRCLRMSGEEAAVLEVTGATKLLPGTEVVALRDLHVHPCTESEDGKTIYSRRQQLLRRGEAARVRRNFGEEGEAGPVSVEPRGRSACDGYLYVPPEEVGSLQPQGGERLGEFRRRAALAMGMLPHRLRLALPDGRLLPESQDALELRGLLQHLPAAP